MLEQIIIEKLARELTIAPEHIAREAYEIFLLRELSESSVGTKLVLKGGTALRLAYSSPRFSEDLDFSLLQKIQMKDIVQIVKSSTKHFDSIRITDLSDKHYTFFILLRIQETFLGQAFSIKLEISKRPIPKKPRPFYELVSLSTPSSPLKVFMKVATKDAIWEDKLKAIQRRIKPRDIFDLWFLSRELKKPLSLKIAGFSKTLIKQELNKFLPRKYHYIVEEITKNYVNTTGQKKDRKH